jgi:hypothetical protein
LVSKKGYESLDSIIKEKLLTMSIKKRMYDLRHMKKNIKNLSYIFQSLLLQLTLLDFIYKDIFFRFIA